MGSGEYGPHHFGAVGPLRNEEVLLSPTVVHVALAAVVVVVAVTLAFAALAFVEDAFESRLWQSSISSCAVDDVSSSSSTLVAVDHRKDESFSYLSLA
jgi:hypothetical protein